MNPAVSVIIVSYNTRDITLACIQSVIEQTRECKYEIIVLDNNSSDGSGEAIRERFPQVNLIASKENLGFARGNNVAAQCATGVRLLLLNPDTVILDGAIDRLLEFAERTPKAGIWGGRAVFPDGTANVTCWSDMTLWSLICRALGLTWAFPKSRLFNPEAIQKWDPLEQEREVDIVVGCFLLIDANLWRKLNGFNPDFFMYGDEVDLCLRGRKLGAQPKMTPGAVIIHYGGGSEPSSEDKLIKVFKGRITVMNKHWSPAAARLGASIVVATVALRALASLVIRPPRRRGSGQDGRADVWLGAFRRRNEWAAGWAGSPVN